MGATYRAGTFKKLNKINFIIQHSNVISLGVHTCNSHRVYLEILNLANNFVGPFDKLDILLAGHSESGAFRFVGSRPVQWPELYHNTRERISCKWVSLSIHTCAGTKELSVGLLPEYNHNPCSGSLCTGYVVLAPYTFAIRRNVDGSSPSLVAWLAYLFYKNSCFCSLFLSIQLCAHKNNSFCIGAYG